MLTLNCKFFVEGSGFMNNKLKSLFTELDLTTLKIMKIGFKICFSILIFSVILLVFYLSTYKLFLYDLGLSIFRLSTYFFVEFIICGFTVDKIKKQLQN